MPGTAPALPPIDRDADALIVQQFQQYPEARYRITQTAIVTEAALAEAQNRIQRLQWELEQTRNAAQQAMQQGGGGQQKGFFSSLFGGGGQQQRPGYGQPGGQATWGGGYQPTSPPPQPQYAPGYQPGMFQQGGSGFLGSALTTAAGVAGGMVVGNALMNAFEGHHDSGFGGGASGSPWGAAAGGDPFGGAGVVPTDPTAGFGAASSDPFGGGGTPDRDVFGQGSADPGTWDQASSADTGGSFDSGGGGFDSGGFDQNT